LFIYKDVAQAIPILNDGKLTLNYCKMLTTKRKLVTGHQRTIKKNHADHRNSQLSVFLLDFAVFTNKYKVNALKTFQNITH